MVDGPYIHKEVAEKINNLPANLRAKAAYRVFAAGFRYGTMHDIDADLILKKLELSDEERQRLSKIL